MPTADITNYLELFLQTALDHVAALETLISQLQPDISNKSTIEEIFRHIHSLKGSSSVMGYTQIATNCAKIDLIIHPESGKFTYSEDASTTLMKLTQNVKDVLEKASNES